jgi:uncharacterized protein (DUF433 family)
MNFNSRITLDPDICHGKPCIRGLRYPVTLILELLASGMSHSEILTDYPVLEAEDILAYLQYAARMSDVKSVSKATACAGSSPPDRRSDPMWANPT